MCDSQKNIKKYRVVWKISDKLNERDIITSYEFKIGDAKWFIKMTIKSSYGSALDHFLYAYTLFLCGPPGDTAKILKNSFYLLSDEINHKFENKSKLQTNSSPYTKFVEKKILVCAFDVACDASGENSMHWIEGKTEVAERDEEKLQGGTNDIISLSFESTGMHRVNLSQQENLIIASTSGLNEGEYLTVISRNLKFLVGPGKSEHVKEADGRLFNNFYVASKLCEFQQMNKEGIAEIANIIELQFSDSLLDEHREDPKDSVALLPINNTSAQPAPAAATANELMFKCFTDKQFCDITIQVAGGPNILAHKVVLISRSTVWHHLLAADNQLSIINVTEFDAQIIEALLTFIYINFVPESLTSWNQLLIAAETYGVDDLKTACEQRLMDTITKDTAINLLVLAHRYNAKVLFDCALDFVRKHISALKESDEWKLVIFQYPELTFELCKILL